MKKAYMVGNKRGAALIVLIMAFILVALITSFGLYNSVYNVAKMQGIDEVRRIRGHYIASSGITYATILLEDPDSISYKADGVTVNNSAYPAFFTDIGVNTSDLTITITQITSGPHAGEYDVESTYSF